MDHNVKASAVIGWRSCPLGGTLIQHRHEPIRSDRLRVARYRLRLPPASPARNSKAGKKESTGRRLSQRCPPCARPSSNSSLDYRRSVARIVENGFATSGGLSKSAKVVLGRPDAGHCASGPGGQAAIDALSPDLDAPQPTSTPWSRYERRAR